MTATPVLTDLLDLSGPTRDAVAVHGAAAAEPRRLPKPIAAFLRVPRVWTWTGLVVVAAGLVLITIGWGDVAGTEDVGDQLPYVMSAGFTGLALVCIGSTLVAIDAKLTDSAARRNQAIEMRDALADLRAVDEAAVAKLSELARAAEAYRADTPQPVRRRRGAASA